MGGGPAAIGCGEVDSNHRPEVYETPALTAAPSRKMLPRLKLLDGAGGTSARGVIVSPCPIEQGVTESKLADGAQIRTREGVTPAGFQDQCLRPLGHPSVFLATTIGLEPTSSTFGRSRSSS